MSTNYILFHSDPAKINDYSAKFKNKDQQLLAALHSKWIHWSFAFIFFFCFFFPSSWMTLNTSGIIKSEVSEQATIHYVTQTTFLHCQVCLPTQIAYTPVMDSWWITLKITRRWHNGLPFVSALIDLPCCSRLMLGDLFLPTSGSLSRLISATMPSTKLYLCSLIRELAFVSTWSRRVQALVHVYNVTMVAIVSSLLY